MACESYSLTYWLIGSHSGSLLINRSGRLINFSYWLTGVNKASWLSRGVISAWARAARLGTNPIRRTRKRKLIHDTHRLRINFPFRWFHFSLRTWAAAALTWAEGEYTWAGGEHAGAEPEQAWASLSKPKQAWAEPEQSLSKPEQAWASLSKPEQSRSRAGVEPKQSLSRA
jgi:hypothetical protein